MSEFEYNDDLVPCTGNDYDSAFESDRDGRKRKQKATNDNLPASSASNTSESRVKLKETKKHFREEHSREERRRERYNVLSLDAYGRHKKLINDYFLCYKGQAEKLKRDTSRDKTDADVLHENHRFVWDDVDTSNLTWGERLAKKYYDKLFKEYCITDLRFYKENKIAFRWRTEQEVIVGKGQFSCGEKNCKTMDTSNLRSWEVNFAYLENDERKNALVKVRLCPECSKKLNFKKARREVKKEKSRAEHPGTSEDPKRKSADKKDRTKKRKRQKRDENVSSESGESSASDVEETVKVLEEKRMEEDNPWAKPLKQDEVANIADEFDAFLDEMLV